MIFLLSIILFKNLVNLYLDPLKNGKVIAVRGLANDEIKFAYKDENLKMG